MNGFNTVLGNPPWERVKLQEKEFFASRDEAIATAPNKAARDRLIKALAQAEPGSSERSLYGEFTAAKRQAEGESHLLRNSGMYPLCGRGDVNTYAVFAEGKRKLLNPTGRVGCIVPSGIATDDTTKFFFQDLMQTQSLASLYDLENREATFPSVHRGYKFCLLTMIGREIDFREGADFVFYALNTTHLADDWRHFRLTDAEIALINPNTMTCPVFRSKRDANLTKTIYNHIPILVDEKRDVNENSWEPRFATMFHMSNDSHLFRTREQLEQQQLVLRGNTFLAYGQTYLPLYEGKMFMQFDHRFANVVITDNVSRSGQPQECSSQDKEDDVFLPYPQYWVSAQSVDHFLQSFEENYLLTFKAITASTNERSMIATIIPRVAIHDNAPLLLSNRWTPLKNLGLLCCLNSFVFDFCTRQKMGTVKIMKYVLYQLPVLPPSTYDQPCPWHPGQSLAEWIRPRVLELTYTAWDLEPFARDVVSEADDSFREQVKAVTFDPAKVPYNLDHLLSSASVPACGSKESGGTETAATGQHTIPPYHWDEERRFLMRCELDAAYFHLYLGSEGDWGRRGGKTYHPDGRETTDAPQLRAAFPSPRDAVEHIMDSFPIVKRKDEVKYKIEVRPGDPRYPEDISKLDVGDDGSVEVGDFRTKRVILEIYDEMQRCINKRKPYQTLLSPPPASPEVAHPSEPKAQKEES